MSHPIPDEPPGMWRADVAIYLKDTVQGGRAAESPSENITHLDCHFAVEGAETPDIVQNALLRDALRQMRRMPESRLGGVYLEDLTHIIPVQRAQWPP